MDMETAVRKLGGVWPPYRGIAPEDDKPGVLFSAAAFDLLYISNGPGKPSTGIGTHAEFDATTAMLRYEPDWKDAPDWAVAKAQDSDGCWWWYSAVPSEGSIMFHSDEQVVFACKGEVIGDWKQTLRLRPEENEVEEKHVWSTKVGFPVMEEGKEVERLSLKEGNEVFEAAVVREQLDREGVPRTSNPMPFFPEGAIYSLWGRVKRFKEMAIEAEFVKRVNELQGAPAEDWHQRGEFPPAGTVCEVLYVCTWRQTKIIGWNDDAIVFTTEWDDTYSYDGLLAEPSMFRPIQTERERLFKTATDVVKDARTPGNAVSLLDKAGMLKMPEEK